MAKPQARMKHRTAAQIAELCLQSAEDYHFHGPSGDLGFNELHAYYVSLRTTFSNLRIVHEQIIAEGRFLAARNTFSGDFTGVLAHRPGRAHRPARQVGSDQHVHEDGDERLVKE